MVCQFTRGMWNYIWLVTNPPKALLNMLCVFSKSVQRILENGVQYRFNYNFLDCVSCVKTVTKILGFSNIDRGFMVDFNRKISRTKEVTSLKILNNLKFVNSKVAQKDGGFFILFLWLYWWIMSYNSLSVSQLEMLVILLREKYFSFYCCFRGFYSEHVLKIGSN